MSDLIYRTQREKNQKLVDEISNTMNKLLDTNITLNDKIVNFNKDKEIQKMKEELQNLQRNSLYEMSEEQTNNARDFSLNHYDSCKGNISYILTPTGVGMGISVQCHKCKENLDLTNYDCW